MQSPGRIARSAPRRAAVAAALVALVGLLITTSYAFAAAPSTAPANAAPSGAPPLLDSPASTAAKLPHLASSAAPAARVPANWGPGVGLPGAAAALSMLRARPGSSSTVSNFTEQHCAGVWPTVGGQSRYANDCYGHDEPGISFYSGLPGSGGNVTWNVTLPVDGSATQNQSDLYVAVWFGLTVSAPTAWMHQCFLELQFYPDASFTSSSTVNGNWVGEAVAWQINVTTGFEDLCYAAPLVVTSGAGGFLNMNQGDQVLVTMEGWSGSPYGENITVLDESSGQTAFLTMYNYGLGQPIDPAYATNAWTSSLQWTPGGEPPVTFAFETGHAGNPSFPSNSSYGGCTPGAPPPTVQDPSVPCPSYDPASWVNDTAQPWHIQPPTFSSGSRQETPAQVDFTQDFGGVDAITTLSNGSCASSIGSAYCSYPWYSYACSVHAFEFGATDYTGVTSDFGQFNEYTSVNSTNGLDLLYFAPANYSIPTCGGAAASLSVNGGGALGSATFLGHTVANSSRFGGLGLGSYALSASAAPGERFAGWTTTGSASIATPSSARASLVLAGNGTVSATFSPGAALSTVFFNDTPASGRIAVYAGADFNGGTPLATLADGGSLALPSGVYGIQAYPPAGYVFQQYASVGPGLGVAAPTYPYTWLTVEGDSSVSSLRAESLPSPLHASVRFVGVGNGTLSFDGTVAPYDNATESSALTVSPHVGAYNVSALPAPGWAFLGWTTSGVLVQSDFTPTTNITFEAGASYVEADFGAMVTLLTLPAPSSGAVLLNGVGPLHNDSSQNLGPGNYRLDALPHGNTSFSHWNVSDPAALWVVHPNAAITRLVVNSSGSVTAVFAAGRGYALVLDPAPNGSGVIVFNGFERVGAPTTNDSVASGSYLISAAPNPGYRFTGWTVTGTLTLANGILGVHGGGGTVTAHFQERVFPVTFVAVPSGGVAAVLNGTALSSGESLLLAAGTYGLSAMASTAATFASWSSTLPIGSPSEAVTNLTVNAPGTITALAVAFRIASLGVDRAVTEVGFPVTFTLRVNGSGPFAYHWNGLPNGCTGRSAPTLPCTPGAAGTVNVSVTVTGFSGVPVTSAPVELAVLPPVAIGSFGATPSAVDSGARVAFNATTTGGLAPFAWSYRGLPSGCAGPNQSSFGCVMVGAGPYTVEVEATDVLGASGFANVTVTLTARPSIGTFSVAPSPTTASHPVVFHAAVLGGAGTPSLRYLGLPASCPSANSLNLACTPASAGSFIVEVVATDAFGVSAYANATLLVNPRPSVSAFTARPASVAANSTVTIQVTASGGTGTLRYAYSGLPAGCVGANVSAIVCAPTVPGSYALNVTVTDALGVSSSAVTPLTVSAPTAPSGPGGSGTSSSPYLLYLALAAAGGAGLVLVSYWVSRRYLGAPPILPK